MDYAQIPPRPFRFGLRTLFVLVTVVSMWCAYSKNWIRQRRALYQVYIVVTSDMISPESGMRVRAPCGLWLFGEEGAVQVTIHAGVNEAEFERVCRLFPEANVWDEPIFDDPD